MSKLQVLHLEDNSTDAFFVSQALERHGIDAEITLVTTPANFRARIDSGKPDLILIDNGVPGFDGVAALKAARARHPDVPMIVVSGAADEDHVRAAMEAGACDFVLKDQLWQLVNAIRRIQGAGGRGGGHTDGEYEELKQLVRDRTLQLEAASRELEAFSYSVSHDLQAPLRAIGGFTHLLSEKCQGRLDAEGTEYFGYIRSETKRMSDIINDLLKLAKFVRAELHRAPANLSQMAHELSARLQAGTPERKVIFKIQDGWVAQGDPGLLRVVLEHLLANAWKFTAKREKAVIEFGMTTVRDGVAAYFVRDNGVGFEMQHASRLFAPFQRLHRPEDFAGNGVGLATVQRIILRHGGTVWADAKVDEGTTIYFTLPS